MGAAVAASFLLWWANRPLDPPAREVPASFPETPSPRLSPSDPPPGNPTRTDPPPALGPAGPQLSEFPPQPIGAAIRLTAEPPSASTPLLAGQTSEESPSLGLRRAPPAAESDPPPPGLDEATGPPDRLAGYEVVAARGLLTGPGERFYEFRLLRDERGRTVRAVSEYERPANLPTAGTWERTGQSAMAASQVLVSVEDASAERILREWTEGHGARIRNRNPRSPLREVLLPEPTFNAVPEAVDELRAILPLVEPDYLYFPMAREPNDPEYAAQFAYPQIGATQAWEHSTGSREAIVAVIDTGMDLDHPDLAPNLWTAPGEIPDNNLDDDGNGFIDDVHGYDFYEDDNDPDDETGHGTHVSGIVGAVGDNALGVTGVNWEVRLLPLRAGNTSLSASAIVDALDYATALREVHGQPIVATNNSYGGPEGSEFVKQAIERQRDAGILFVAAAGNEDANNDLSPSYPANHEVDNLLSVAATDTGGENLAGYSNYGPTSVDLAAPGSSILSTGRGGGYTYQSGTSMAAPFVAGSLALLHSLDPSLTAPELRDALLAGADSLPGLANWVVDGRFLNLASAALDLDPQPFLDPPAVLDDPLWLAGPTGLRVPLTLRGPDGLAVAEPYGTTTWTVDPAAGAELVRSDRLLGELLLEEEGYYRVTARWDGGGPARSTVAFEVEVRSPDTADDQLFAAWEFEGVPGTSSVLDSSGQANHGTLLGGARTAGPRGQALELDGNTLPTEEGVAVTEPDSAEVTFAAWVRSDSAGSSIFPRIFDGPEYLFYFGRGPEPFTSFAEGNHDTLKFVASRTGEDGVWYSGRDTVGDGIWTHVAVTFDGTAADPLPTFYIDGEEQETIAQVLPSGGRAPGGSAATLGNREAGGSWDRPWDGLLDEVRIYERVLAPREIAALAERPNAASPDGPGLAGPSEPLRPYVATSTPVSVEVTPSGWNGSWSVRSGPGPVTFADTNAPATTATFPGEGTYELEWSTPLEGIAVFRSLAATARANTYEVWRDSFLNGDSVTLAEETPTADPDADGFSNFWEYATGHDPLEAEDRPASRQLLSIRADPGPNNPGTLDLRFQRPDGRSDLAYRMEWSEHPAGPWENLPASLAPPTVSKLSGGREEVRYEIPPDQLSPASALFFRLIMEPDHPEDPLF